MPYHNPDQQGQEAFSLNLDQDPNKGKKPDLWGNNHCPHCQQQFRVALWLRQNRNNGSYFYGGVVTIPQQQAPIQAQSPQQVGPQGQPLNAPFVAQPPQPQPSGMNVSQGAPWDHQDPGSDYYPPNPPGGQRYQGD